MKAQQQELEAKLDKEPLPETEFANNAIKWLYLRETRDGSLKDITGTPKGVMPPVMGNGRYSAKQVEEEED